jgi:hypothetical protein
LKTARLWSLLDRSWGQRQNYCRVIGVGDFRAAGVEGFSANILEPCTRLHSHLKEMASFIDREMPKNLRRKDIVPLKIIGPEMFSFLIQDILENLTSMDDNSPIKTSRFRKELADLFSSTDTSGVKR